MIFRYLGYPELKVSEICMGVMTFEGDTLKNELATVSQKDADIITSNALEFGIFFFDTMYIPGVILILFLAKPKETNERKLLSAPRSALQGEINLMKQAFPGLILY